MTEAIPPLTIIWPIPPGTENPFAFAASVLISQMYPQLLAGFKSRVAGLLSLLVCVIILSAVYLSLTLYDLKRRQRDIWYFRLVQRPAGKYLVINQYLLYPICSIGMGILWIVLVVHNYQVYGNNHGRAENTLMFTPLLWIPLYTHLSITTFAVLGGANLASTRTGGSKTRDLGSHFLSPLAANLAYIVGFPVIVITCSAMGIWTGLDWRDFVLVWRSCLDVLNTAAANFDGTVDPNIVATATAFAEARKEVYLNFVMTQKVSAAVYITSATALILVNTFGGLRLLLTLRSLSGSGGPASQFVHRNTPLVARLTPLLADPHDLSPSIESISPLSTVQSVRPSLGTRSNSTATILNPSLKRLEWDITLFFLAVVPACLVFISYAAWLSTHYTDVLTHAVLLEFSLFGMQWIYSALVMISTIAMSIKVAFSIRNSNRVYEPSQHRGSTSSGGTNDNNHNFTYTYTRKNSMAKSFATTLGGTSEEEEMNEKEIGEKDSSRSVSIKYGKRKYGSMATVGFGLGLEGMKEVDVEKEGDIEIDVANEIL